MTVTTALNIYQEIANSTACFPPNVLVTAEQVLRLAGYKREAHTVAEHTPSQMSGDWDNNPERNEEA